MKRYSSGLYARLGFSVAIHSNPDIVLVDEVLSVGDAAFQEKCLTKMSEIVSGGRTVLFVSHNPMGIRQLCKTGLYLEKGRLKNFGDIETVMGQYESDYKTAAPAAEEEINIDDIPF